jgi:hypothetical protein
MSKNYKDLIWLKLFDRETGKEILKENLKTSSIPNKKYELTSETKTVGSYILHRIRALRFLMMQEFISKMCGLF